MTGASAIKVPSQQAQAAQLEARLRFALNRERGLRREIADLKDTARFLHGVLIANGIRVPERMRRES
jgi:hypothetical protein